MIEIETLLFTSLVRDDLFAWQERAAAAHAGKKCVRVDTWEIQNHPTPNGNTFTLYACTMVYEHVSKITGEARRGAIRQGG